MITSSTRQSLPPLYDSEIWSGLRREGLRRQLGPEHGEEAGAGPVLAGRTDISAGPPRSPLWTTAVGPGHPGEWASRRPRQGRRLFCPGARDRRHAVGAGQATRRPPRLPRTWRGSHCAAASSPQQTAHRGWRRRLGASRVSGQLVSRRGGKGHDRDTVETRKPGNLEGLGNVGRRAPRYLLGPSKLNYPGRSLGTVSHDSGQLSPTDCMEGPDYGHGAALRAAPIPAARLRSDAFFVVIPGMDGMDGMDVYGSHPSQVLGRTVLAPRLMCRIRLGFSELPQRPSPTAIPQTCPSNHRRRRHFCDWLRRSLCIPPPTANQTWKPFTSHTTHRSLANPWLGCDSSSLVLRISCRRFTNPRCTAG